MRIWKISTKRTIRRRGMTTNSLMRFRIMNRKLICTF